MIRINIKLYGDFKTQAPNNKNEFTRELESRCRLKDIICMLAIPKERCVALINGKRAKDDDGFKNGDTLVIFPEISGG